MVAGIIERQDCGHPEFAKIAGVSYRTMQDIEQGRSGRTLQTVNRILGILGLRLTVGSDGVGALNLTDDAGIFGNGSP